MNPYFAILSANIRGKLQYRMAAMAGVATQVFWGVMQIMVFTAFYRSNSQDQPMQLNEVITYIWLGQAMLGMQPWRVDPQSSHLINSGNIVFELLRPLDFYRHWLCRSFALRFAPTLLRALPVLLLAVAFWGLRMPPTFGSLVAWIVSLLAALFLASAIQTVMDMSLLWTISGKGLSGLMAAMVMMFSGMIIPLPLFPDWLQPLIEFLPFRGLHDLPSRLYMGHLSPNEGILFILHQLTWAVVLCFLGRALLMRGVRRMIVQGG